MTANATTDREQKLIALQNALRGKPCNDPLNRLGEIIDAHEGLGEIRRAKVDSVLVLFAWPVTSTAEVMRFDLEKLEDARFYLNFPQRRVGMDNAGFGTERLGKVIERVGEGEIRKDGVSYYAWEKGADQAIRTLNLKEAREALGKVISHETPKTKPKSAYEQNRKGYKAGSK